MASHFAIKYAAHQIRHGGVIIYPTDTVYGLGCDPMNLDAITYLNQLKRREPGKGLILLSHTLALFEDYIETLTESDQKKILETSQPTSWIVNAKDSLPDWLTNEQRTLAIRITQHPVVTELCQQLGHPIVSTSANPRGKKTSRNALEVHKYFHDKVDAILIDDRHLSGQASTIKRLENLSTIRP
ncbi:MAG: threonylcarbamoyl-AMP synthase [Gammaproteobacteria bacterium]|nr:threonylcarbamoyl-AMP synthase [Gammaproteobacteria bacterium]MCK5263112.1 threonylcarbamoyl-AMP synthase [Gammaproteobacteria bacterium]